MQEIISRAKELLENGTVARVLGWKAGDLPYNPEPAYFETAEELNDFVYNGFCGANLSKYMIEASKLEGKTLVCLKPCDLPSLMEPPISLLLCSWVTQASTAGTSASAPSGSVWVTRFSAVCFPGCCLQTAPER